MSWHRPNIGSRMNREVHVRVWERAEVKFLRATRQCLPLPRRNIDIRFTSINRTTRVVQLTPEGALLLDQIPPAMTAIGQALDSLNNAEKEVRGTLRVTGP